MSKMASKTEVLRHKIAREVFGEIDDDGIREYPSWEIFEKCLEQHKLIKELEHRLANCIELHVKIGDTIYVIPSETNYKINIVNKHEERNKVYEFIVNEIRYNQYGYSVVSWVDNIPFFFLNGDKKAICECFETERFYNETWFITEAEAKAKLREMQDENKETC